MPAVPVMGLTASPTSSTAALGLPRVAAAKSVRAQTGSAVEGVSCEPVLERNGDELLHRESAGIGGMLNARRPRRRSNHNATAAASRPIPVSSALGTSNPGW